MGVMLLGLLVSQCIVAAEDTSSDDGSPLRLLPYEPSYVVLQKAEGDERTLRANFSFKYCLHRNGDSGTPCRSNISDAEWFFSYTGEFDFYVGSPGTRKSSPVINRISNPALHYQSVDKIEPEKIIDLIRVDYAIEHRSNGQTTEVNNPDEILRAQDAYNRNDHVFFDSVSRGSNYLSIEGKWQDRWNSTYYAKLKGYITQASDITWGPLAGRGTQLSDYDMLRFIVKHKIFFDGELSLVGTIGGSGFLNDSWNVEWLLSGNKAIPVYLQAHFGPMQTLSNYTESRRSVGIGMKFVPR